MRIIHLRQRFRNLQRFREIINILAKHGFGHLLEALGFKYFVTLGGRIKTLKEFYPQEAITLPQRFRMVLEDLGPTFIKFGQLLSSRPDLIPPEFAREFEKLLDEATPFSYQQVLATIKDELGKPPQEIFQHFESKPFSSASLAQVHRATLKTGEQVVVKVQRPDIEKKVRSDLSILLDLARLVERRLPELQMYNPVGMIEELSFSVARELDFSIEASNTALLAKMLAEFEGVVVPKVYWDYTTRRILVLDYISGKNIKYYLDHPDAELNRSETSVTLIKCFMKQIFDDGFFHADPHPANIIITEDKKVAIIDCGQMGRLDEDLSTHLVNILLALVNRDFNRAAQEYLSIGIFSEDLDVHKFKRDVSFLVGRYYGIPLRFISMAELGEELSTIARRNKVILPAELLLLAKTVANIESITRKLYPEVNIVELAKPYAQELVRKRYTPKNILKKVLYTAQDLSRLFTKLPESLSDILRLVQQGRMRIAFEHRNLEGLIRTIDTASRRLSFSFIIAALIIGSSTIMATRIEPLLFGYPIIGILGFLFAGILGIWLVINILRSGKI
jgi:ubiquinone biosynthesis protein